MTSRLQEAIRTANIRLDAIEDVTSEPTIRVGITSESTKKL